MYFKKITISIIFLTTFCNLNGQQDFNDFKTLKSEGIMPSDFSNVTSNKIKEDIGNKERDLSKSQEKIFLQGIHYKIDQILHSGMVIYGDEISNYVSDIADKLLKKNHPELRKQLRFYTIKSNESNAFSTDQGIVFVTTGLISQMTSEAQLAFVIGHEIAHYKEKHVIEGFEYRTQKNRNELKQLSSYTKEKEFEADRIGIELYHEAGYINSQILPSFDVLIYSYLPFDEVPFPYTYFNSDLTYIPETFFPDKQYEIKAIEDYDDSKSSHPNIKKRKDEASRLISEYRNWGDHVFQLGEERFTYIRNLCRFESVRTDVADAKYGDALYSIFLLEKEFPNSHYLKRMKAQSWLGLANYKSNSNKNTTYDRLSKLEGENAPLHFLLNKLNVEAMLTLAIRQIHDIKNSLVNNNNEIDAIWLKMIDILISNKKFDIKKYSTSTFHEAALDFLNQKTDTLKEDVTETLNKYEKIKRKKSHIDPSSFDSTKFYYYALSDIVTDSIFNEKYSQINKQKDDLEKEINAYKNLSTSERRKFDSEYQKTALESSKEYILVEPSAISYKKRKVDYDGSDKMKAKYETAIQNAGSSLGLSIHTINSDKMKDLGTIGFNERNVLMNLLMQYFLSEGSDVFPVDYEALKEIEQNYGTSKIVFTIVEHAYRPRMSPYAYYLIFYPPAIIGYIPIPFMNGNKTELNLLVLDTKTGQIETSITNRFNEPVTRLILEARMYDILINMNNQKFK
jgi:beta-barrel assembly-enhancing protease